VTERTAVYRLYDANEVLLYIGMSRDPDKRLEWHKATQAWGSQVCQRSVTWHATREDAALAEVTAISAERPLYNFSNSPYRALEADGMLAAVPKAEHDRAITEAIRNGETRSIPGQGSGSMGAHISTTQAAALTVPPTTRFTVEREIKRHNLVAEKHGGTWVIEATEARRWAAQFKLHARSPR
jgi:predicted GIY-YIG superfamily endonuclease